VFSTTLRAFLIPVLQIRKRFLASLFIASADAPCFLLVGGWGKSPAKKFPGVKARWIYAAYRGAFEAQGKLKPRAPTENPFFSKLLEAGLVIAGTARCASRLSLCPPAQFIENWRMDFVPVRTGAHRLFSTTYAGLCFAQCIEQKFGNR
jgi:hypothetical protein